ncbi:MAG: hypothetical protein IKG27_05500 [Bacilli bacterium]|nr:hypothetical protein [Bacilli bacterium]
MDDIVFVNKDIINDEIIGKIIGMNTYSGIVLIANSLVIGMAIYYAIRYVFSIYTNNQVERPYQFIFKLIVVTLFINSSKFICEQILDLNFYISGSIRSIGENILNTNISFEQLIIKINNIYYTGTTLNVFSFDGIIKSFTSFGLLNLLFSYALRYIILKVFILMTPLVLVTLLNSSTSWIFKSWIKSVISILIVQSIISLILLIIFSTNYIENNVFSKLIYVGSILALMKANVFTSQIFGGISTDVGANINSLKKLINK